jgi:hypothetical protein
MKLSFVLVALVACGGGTGNGGGGGGADATDAPGTTDAFVPVDGQIIIGSDGSPMRQPCTNNYGSELTEMFGRLDGILVAIVQPGAHGCNGDNNHLHLQVRANDAVYDIAVDVGSDDGTADVHTTTRDLTLPLWSEGWHTSGILNDYVTDGVHSTDMPLETLAQVASDITTDLTTVNHISVFSTGYGADGAHLVHREGQGRDGMIVMQPLSSPAHARLFSFSDQAF